MMNVYNGNATLDGRGEAVVMLPPYFEALNRDFRYQLTCIGQFAQAIVAKKIQKNRFTIKTDKPNVEVSWQVTGVRQDAWAKANRIKVELDKPSQERGRYIHPELYGQPTSRRLGAGHRLDRSKLPNPTRVNVRIRSRSEGS
jgi:trimeric autotransporter adhesin